MCLQYIAEIYRGLRVDKGQKVVFLENYLAGTVVENISSIDRERNLPYLFESLFSSGCRDKVDHVYTEALNSMRERPFADCADTIDALSFLQEVVAAAMWKYRLTVGAKLEEFARKFDRLDVEEEQRRIYEGAQLDVS